MLYSFLICFDILTVYYRNTDTNSGACELCLRKHVLHAIFQFVFTMQAMNFISFLIDHSTVYPVVTHAVKLELL